MNNHQKKFLVTFLLVFILFCFALAIRLYKVSSAPSGMLIDEVSHGYNAYSILKTGKDEHGISFPLVFKAFGDQKLPLYTYLIVPAIKVFGLTALAVRLPSVLAGSFLPVVIFFLLLELGFTKKVSFLGGVIAATAPWMIIISRFGYESNVGLLCFTVGLFFAFRSLQNKNFVNLIAAGLFFGLSLYSYVAFRFITPLILLCFLLLHFKESVLSTKSKLILITSFILTIAPLALILLSPQGTVRFNQAGSGFSTGLKMEIDENRTFCSQQLPKIVCYAASNKPLFLARTYFYRYIESFSPQYLFLTGDAKDPSLHVDNFGLFYAWLLPFYILGMLVMINRFRNRQFLAIDMFIIVGFVISVTPSVLVGSPHILRLTALFPFMLVVLMYGVSQLENLMRRKKEKQGFHLILSGASLLSVLFFIILFLTVHVQKYETAFRTYVSPLMKYLGTQNPHTQIYINSLTEGIIYYSFINKVDPTVYQKEVIRYKPDAVGFAHASDLLNVHITNESLTILGCRLKRQNVNALYVSNEDISDLPKEAKKIIYSENGVLTLAVIYDFTKINTDLLKCVVIR